VTEIDTRHGWFFKLYILLIFVFLYLPVVVLIVFSFNESPIIGVWSGFSLRWYEALLQNRAVVTAAKNSMIVSFSATLIATVIGTTTALLMERKGWFRGKNVIDPLLYMPLMVPEVVFAISLLTVFTLIGLRLSFLTLIISHVAFITAFVIITIRVRLAGTNRSLEEAAMDLGANEWKTFWHVTFPILLPGIIGGALLGFAISLEDFVITFFTAGPGSSTLPLWIWGTLRRGISPDINALSTIMVLVSVSIVLIAQVINRKKA
jgi:spermidine/putrescine transport system permease protein